MSNEPKLRILGIDPGYGRLGVAVVEQDGSTDKLLFSACFETSPDLAFSDRLRQVIETLERVVGAWEPSLCAVEKLFFQNNRKTAMRVAETRGAILAHIAAYPIELIELSPQDIKIAVTGHGGAKKADVARMVELILRLPVAQRHDDEYDAIACGIAGSRHRTNLSR